jgi:glycine cleavage system H protein
MNVPENLSYTKSHEWIKTLDHGIIEIGITDYAQNELGDIVFVNLPQPGDAVTTGKPFADIESVKAVSDIFSPVSGTVKEANQTLLDAPGSINSAPYDAWLIRAEGAIPSGELLSPGEYKALLG